MFKSSISRTHLLMLIVFQLALFLPMIGHGFVFDDFNHLYSAAFQPILAGITRVQGGPFFNPVAWLTFKADWILWDGRSFPMAVENLLVHIANTLLLYLLGLQLLKSAVAACWTAVGFALLFPANTWTVMYIATRAHLIATLFYLAALLAGLWYACTIRSKILAAISIVVCAGLSMFAKESGVTVIAAILVMLVHQRQSLKQRAFRVGDLLVFMSLFGLLAVYAGLRWQSGAVFLSSSPDTDFSRMYSYAFSARRLADNLLRYVWRTYGLLAIVACAIIASAYLSGRYYRPKLPTRREVLLSVTLFAVTLAPFILLSVRSATYSYLPGIGAALLLGAVARSVHAATGKPPLRSVVITAAPIVFVIATYIGLTIGQSLKWVRMGEVSRTVLEQIAAHQPDVKPNTFFLLKYSEVDHRHRFPDAFSGGVFSPALRLQYRDPSLDGKIIRYGEPYTIDDRSSTVELEYLIINDTPTIAKAQKH